MRILIVDDEPQIRTIVRRLLVDEGYAVEAVASGEEGVKKALQWQPDLVLMDLSLPGVDGIDTMEMLRARGVNTHVILMTAYGTVDSAVWAMRLGAYHYIEKPFDNEELLNLIGRALDHRMLSTRVKDLEGQLRDRYDRQNTIGVSDRFQAVFSQVMRAAQSDATVLIEGDSGTGKELIVRALYQESSRHNGPFVALNCAALPAHLIESELFGHEAGAFTDARKLHAGKFEQASGGVLFLDEVGELPLEGQGKLLRVIQERELTRVGGHETIPVDVRLVSATNRDMEALVRDGLFREDLYYRINVVAIRMPTLRERQEDIPLLVDYVLDRFNVDSRRRVTGVDDEVMAVFREYAWPGNVRELENVVQGAAIMCLGEVIGVDDLPLRLRRPGTRDAGEELGSLAEAVAAVERRTIATALELEHGNRTRTAGRLGITRKTLLAKITTYGLE